MQPVKLTIKQLGATTWSHSSIKSGSNIVFEVHHMEKAEFKTISGFENNCTCHEILI